MKRATFGIVVISLLMLAGPTTAGIHQVWDQGHAFKPATIVEVDQILSEIHEKFHKDLMIETFASIPDDFKPKYQEDGAQKFFENWANSEGATLQLNGIILLICRDPRHVQVGIGKATVQKAFTEADRDELLRTMMPLLHQNQYDEGILAGVRFVRDRIAKNFGENPTTQPSSQASESK